MDGNTNVNNVNNGNNVNNSELTYGAAIARLENINKQLEQGNIPLEELSSKVKEANELIALCESKLKGVEQEINPVKPDTK